jgi:biotin synthase
MTVDELVDYITASGQQADDLRAWGNRVRRDNVGEFVHFRGIVEFSNVCRCHCHYCGLRTENDSLSRYRLTPEEIVEAAEMGEQMGLRTVVLQSGEDEWWTAQQVADLIVAIKSRTRMAVTLSIGERPAWEYRLWRQAGADRYLLKHETADPDLYAALHPGDTLEQRIRCLETLREIGFQIGSGCIVGLPDQTPEVLARDLLLMQRLQVHMAGIGPLVPHPDTPLRGMEIGSAQTALNMMALLRILVPDVMMAATTALETIMEGGRLAALRAGGNVIMPNITPRQCASFYEIYPGKRAPQITVQAEVERAKQVVLAAARPIADDPGHSPRLQAAGRA